MPASLKLEGWEGSLREWIEFARGEYFSAEVLRGYQEWLAEQVAKPLNVVPFRLVSGRAPKGAEFVRRADGTVFYAADNEPLAGIWGLVSRDSRAPDVDLKDLLARGVVPGSWPPKQLPARFRCRWGPARLSLKDRGMKLAHLLDSGRNGIPIDPEQLHRRALLTLSLVNCFPMPNRSFVEFSRNNMISGDLAELPEVQSLLLSFIRDLLQGSTLIELLFAAFGAGCRVALDSAWERKANEFRFAVRPKSESQQANRVLHAVRGAAKRSSQNGPMAFLPSTALLPDLHAVIVELKTWLAKHPSVQRLDDVVGPPNGRPQVRFNVQHIAESDFVMNRPSFPGTKWSAADYTGVFVLNGDTKVAAVRRLIEMDESGLDLDEIIEPDITRLRTLKGQPTGEKPRFILTGANDAEGLYCYPAKTDFG